MTVINYSDNPSGFKNAWLNLNNPKSIRIDFVDFKSKVLPSGDENPQSLGWYEHNNKKKKYVLTTDTSVAENKDYYTIGSLSYSDYDIEGNSFSLKKSIQNGNNLDFMGCISSTLEFKVANDFKPIIDQKITVTLITVENDTQWEIKVFTGLVDEVKRDKSRDLVRKVTAHDFLYRLLDDYEVTDWYVWQYGEGDDESVNPKSIETLINTFWDYICNTGTVHALDDPNKCTIEKKGEGWGQKSGAVDNLINRTVQVPKTLDVSLVEYDPQIGSSLIGGPWTKPINQSEITYTIPDGIDEGWGITNPVARKDVIQLGLAGTSFTYTYGGVTKTNTDYRDYLDDCDTGHLGLAATITIKRELENIRNTQISAATVLQAFCQANACFGQFNGNGEFEYISLDITNPLEIEEQYQISVGHSDIKMPSLTGVVIFDKTSEEYSNDTIHTEHGDVKNNKKGSALAYYPTDDFTKIEGDDAHVFTMDDNFLMNTLTQDQAIGIAQRIYEHVSNLTMRNSEVEIFAMPWLTCGQAICYYAPTENTLYPAEDLYPNPNLYPSGYEKITSVIMSYNISGTGLIKAKIECKAEELSSDIVDLNEIISSEIFYRKIGDSQQYSEIKQTKESLEFRVAKTENEYSEIKQTSERIELSVVDLNAQTSGIQTEIIMTKNEIAIHAQTISMLSNQLTVVSGRIDVQARDIEVLADDVRVVTEHGVTFEDLRTGGRTVINGSNIKTGTISCSRIGFGEVTIGGLTKDVDWMLFSEPIIDINDYPLEQVPAAIVNSTNPLTVTTDEETGYVTGVSLNYGVGHMIRFKEPTSTNPTIAYACRYRDDGLVQKRFFYLGSSAFTDQ